MSPENPNDEEEIPWWQGLIIGALLLGIAVSNILYRGGISDPFTAGMLVLAIFASYLIYDAIEDYRSPPTEGQEGDPTEGQEGDAAPSEQGPKSWGQRVVEDWQARNRSTSAVIYTWFTIGFAAIFLLPSTEWWGPVRLLVLTLAGGAIWVRSGGEGPAETTTERVKRFGAGMAGILSGLVIALSVRWLLLRLS
jgi:hypothetical protein